MKQFLLSLLSFFSYSIGFSQSEKEIHGKVLSGEIALSGIDIVNMSSKKSTTTDSNGHFSILAKVGDQLFIISKEYTDRKINLKQDHINENNLIIQLEKKPIELEDVNVVGVKSQKIKVSQADVDEIKISKEAKSLKVPNVYDGTIPNGMDFMRMGQGLINLFKNKDKVKPPKPLPPVPFKDYLSSNFDQAFYTQKLKIKLEEIDLFIAFCEADPKSRSISEHQDVLEAIDFLMTKNEEFKKLER